MSKDATLQNLRTKATLRRRGSSLSHALIVFDLLVLFKIDPSSLLVEPSWGPPGVVVVESFGQKSDQNNSTSADTSEGLKALAAETTPTIVRPTKRVRTVRSMSRTVRSSPNC